MTVQTTIRPATTTTTAAPTGRRGNVALWVLQVLTAGVFVMASLPKLTADPRATGGFEVLGGQTTMYLIGSLELLGAVALLIPLLSGLAGLAYIGLMVGAIIVNALTLPPVMVVPPAVVLVLVAVIAWGRRDRTAQLVTVVRRLAHR